MRRRAARIGIFAILFQAMLFGWHHHSLPPISRGAQPGVHAAGGAPLSPAGAEDDCDICAALHHLTAAPGTLAAILPPPARAAVQLPPASAVGHAPSEQGFRARAPPQA